MSDNKNICEQFRESLKFMDVMLKEKIIKGISVEQMNKLPENTQTEMIVVHGFIIPATIIAHDFAKKYYYSMCGQKSLK